MLPTLDTYFLGAVRNMGRTLKLYVFYKYRLAAEPYISSSQTSRGENNLCN
jgi:hypothetical protein